MLLLAKKIILGYDVENIIASYCSAKTLCNLESLRKKNLSEIDSENVLEATWKVLVNKRWRLRGNILRAVGASSWKVAYQVILCVILVVYDILYYLYHIYAYFHMS